MTTATYLGTPDSGFVPVAVAVVTPSTPTVLVAGNGPQRFGRTPDVILVGNTSSNASIAVLEVNSGAAPAVSTLYTLGNRIDHMSVTKVDSGSGDYVAVAGDFGIALMQYTQGKV